MKVYLNNICRDILPGMTVRHLLVNAGVLDEIAQGKSVVDEWGNEIGLDGELTGGEKVFLVSHRGGQKSSAPLS